MWLLLLFLVMPLVELFVILQVGSAIGGWWTVLVLLVDSLVGAVIVRREGRRAWTAFRTALAEARWPGDEVAQGGLVLVGGALLLTPGFVTDVLGLSFVLPPTRRLWSVVVRRRFTGMTVGAVGGSVFGAGVRPPGTPTDDARRDGQSGGRVIDVEVVDIRRNDDP